MLHGRVLRPASVGAKLIAVDESSIKKFKGARVVRVNDFVGVVAADEWAAISAAKSLKLAWSDERSLIGHEAVRAWMRAGPFESDEFLVRKGDSRQALAGAATRISGEYYWPMQTHGSMGPSCAVADVRDGRATIWSASQATHRFRLTIARVLGPEAAGIAQVPGIATGLISQNGNPPYAVEHQEVLVHWLATAPLRPSNFRAPGKVANCFAVESFADELAAAAGRDAVAFRLQGLSDPRGIEVLRRAAALLGWQARPAPAKTGAGRGIAYIHYKNNESYVAMAMEVDVERSSGAIRVRRVACARDCGLVINPDALRAQIEGNILQTLSRTLFEEVAFDRSRVTSVDWASYPILTFHDVPEILIDLVDRPREPPLGAGEAAATPVPAALANAVFDAAGIRLRTVPFTRQRVLAALA